MCELPIEIQSPEPDANLSELKKCIACEKWKPLSLFRRDRDRWHPRCVECANYISKVTNKIRKTAPPVPDACECCGTPIKYCPKQILVMDHDHDTETFRGWICEKCNIGLGKLGDTLEGLTKAVEYLKRSNNINQPSVLMLEYTEELDDKLESQ